MIFPFPYLLLKSYLLKCLTGLLIFRQELGRETDAILWVLFCKEALGLHRYSGNNTDVWTLPWTSNVHAQSCSSPTEISLQVQPRYLPGASETEYISKTGSHAILQGWNLYHYCKHFTFGCVFYLVFQIELSLTKTLLIKCDAHVDSEMC